MFNVNLQTSAFRSIYCIVIAYIITVKFFDHQPLYRQREVYAREQVPVALSTMSGWLWESDWLLKPIVTAMRQELLNGAVLHTDDTIVPVLEPGLGYTRDGRLWVYLRDKRFGKPCAVYDYTPTGSPIRSGAQVKRLNTMAGRTVSGIIIKKQTCRYHRRPGQTMGLFYPLYPGRAPAPA